MPARNSATWYIYALRLKTDDEYRYVGLTTGTVGRRLYEHLIDARRGVKRPLHDWMRKHAGLVVADILEEQVAGDLDALEFAESRWIATLREQHRLGLKAKPMLNLTDGGHTTTGMIYSDEHREKKRQQMSGEGNNQYGRRGELAPCYGRVGELHPMYGQHHTPEAKVKISQANKGRLRTDLQRYRMARGAHNRHHASKNIFKPGCPSCEGRYDESTFVVNPVPTGDRRSTDGGPAAAGEVG